MKKHILCTVCIFLILLACNQRGKSYTSPAGYNLNEPEKFFMPSSLHEISGICFYNNSDTMYAIQDEKGNVYYSVLNDNEWKHTKFAKDGDYEDIAVCNNYIVVLRSDGTLFSFPFAELGKEEADHVQEWKDILPKGEYESLAKGNDNRLYVLCKNCKDDKSETVSGYVLQLNDSGIIVQQGNFMIDAVKALNMSYEKKGRFEPSAIAYKSNSHEWYIFSSVNKMLVITDDDFKIKEMHSLDPALYNQPEGICFDRNNVLYISNEAGELKNGSVYKMAPTP